MKRHVFIGLVAMMSLGTHAQDDMYFVPTKKNIDAEIKKERIVDLEEGTRTPTRDVDEYNRMARSSYVLLDSADNEVVSFDGRAGVNDTVYVADIPRVYTDSTADYALNVRAVKMYDYRLDIFRVDTITRYIQEKPAEPKKRGKMGQSVVVGLQFGYGLGVQPATMQARFEPYIGIGITYGFGFTF